MRMVRSVTTTDGASRILDSLSDALDAAQVANTLQTLNPFVSSAQSSIQQARDAIIQARLAVAAGTFESANAGNLEVDRNPVVQAAAETVVVLNMLSAGSITLRFAAARLNADL